MARRRRQELYCHACDKYVQFVVDMELDGNHVLKCPNCEHEHCRVVREGHITDIRWDSRNGPTYFVNSTLTTFTIGSNWTNTTCSAVFNTIGY
jgi:hypothetical protein